MQHTTNYNLPQWEASDAVRREDVNGAMSAIDAALAGLAPPLVKLYDVTTEGDQYTVYVRLSGVDLTPYRALYFSADPVVTGETHMQVIDVTSYNYMKLGAESGTSYTSTDCGSSKMDNFYRLHLSSVIRPHGDGHVQIATFATSLAVQATLNFYSYAGAWADFPGFKLYCTNGLDRLRAGSRFTIYGIRA